MASSPLAITSDGGHSGRSTECHGLVVSVRSSSSGFVIATKLSLLRVYTWLHLPATNHRAAGSLLAYISMHVGQRIIQHIPNLSSDLQPKMSDPRARGG